MASPIDTATFLPLVISLVASLATIVIHALALIAIIRFLSLERRLRRAGVRFRRDVGIAAGARSVAGASGAGPFD